MIEKPHELRVGRYELLPADDPTTVWIEQAMVAMKKIWFATHPKGERRWESWNVARLLGPITRWTHIELEVWAGLGSHGLPVREGSIKWSLSDAPAWHPEVADRMVLYPQSSVLSLDAQIDTRPKREWRTFLDRLVRWEEQVHSRNLMLGISPTEAGWMGSCRLRRMPPGGTAGGPFHKGAMPMEVTS